MWGSLIPMKIWSSTTHPASTEGLRVGGVVGRSYWDTCSVSSPTLSGWKLQIYKKMCDRKSQTCIIISYAPPCRSIVADLSAQLHNLNFL